MALLFSTFVEALNRIHKETLPNTAANRDALSLISNMNFHFSLSTKKFIDIYKLEKNVNFCLKLYFFELKYTVV